jgi:hypothetical protein
VLHENMPRQAPARPANCRVCGCPLDETTCPGHVRRKYGLICADDWKKEHPSKPRSVRSPRTPAVTVDRHPGKSEGLADLIDLLEVRGRNLQVLLEELNGLLAIAEGDTKLPLSTGQKVSEINQALFNADVQMLIAIQTLAALLDCVEDTRPQPATKETTP